MLNTTSNGIYYDWYNASNRKVNITLMPIEGVHSIVQIVDAKSELAIKRNINKFDIKWQQPPKKNSIPKTK
jgi:hypothetical protein